MQSAYANVVFKPTTHVPGSSGLMYITFCTGAKEWKDLGLIPGALFASVDKLDGHIWSDEEMYTLSDTVK